MRGKSSDLGVDEDAKNSAKRDFQATTQRRRTCAVCPTGTITVEPSVKILHRLFVLRKSMSSHEKWPGPRIHCPNDHELTSLTERMNHSILTRLAEKSNSSSLYMHYTISRDLTGSDDSVKTKLLSALGEREERRAGFSKQFLDSTGSETDSNNIILSRLGERSDKKRRALQRLGDGESTTTSNDTAAGRDDPSLETYDWIPFPVDFHRHHLVLGNIDPDIADDEIQRVCPSGTNHSMVQMTSLGLRHFCSSRRSRSVIWPAR
jgi:hypothetical protein